MLALLYCFVFNPGRLVSPKWRQCPLWTIVLHVAHAPLVCATRVVRGVRLMCLVSRQLG
jgi:hypothetical protein